MRITRGRRQSIVFLTRRHRLRVSAGRYRYVFQNQGGGFWTLSLGFVLFIHMPRRG